MFRLEQITYFVTTVEKGSLNKAAKALYISQPALTKQLAQLERQLNCVLFYRRMTGIELTEAGRFLYERACGILEQVDQTISGIARFAHSVPLRIGALPSIANHDLPDRLERLKSEQQYNIAITVCDTTDELVALMQQSSIDIAFGQDLDENTQIPHIMLCKEPYLAVLPASHRWAREQSIDFAAFCREKLVLHRDPCDIRRSFRRVCNKAGLHPENVLEMDFNDSLLSYAAKGFGLTIVPKMVGDQLRDPSLLVKPFSLPNDSFGRSIYLIYNENFAEVAARVSQTSAP